MASVSTLKDIDQPSDSRTNGYFTDRTVSGGRERQLRELDGKGEETLADLTSWLKEHSPSSQTLVSKRQFQNNKDWVIDERVLDSTDMPSDKMSSERMEESVPPPPLTRADRITAILLRDETLDLLEAIERQDMAFILSSYRLLHTFADLVTEDLVSIQEGHLVVTPVAEQFIEEIASWNEEDDAELLSSDEEEG